MLSVDAGHVVMAGAYWEKEAWLACSHDKCDGLHHDGACEEEEKGGKTDRWDLNESEPRSLALSLHQHPSYSLIQSLR